MSAKYNKLSIAVSDEDQVLDEVELPEVDLTAEVENLISEFGPVLDVLIDPKWYFVRQLNQSEGVGIREALHHYLTEGASQGFDPGPLFDTNYYIFANDLSADEFVNPLVHFLRVGALDGKLHHPLIQLKPDFNRPDWGLSFNEIFAEGGRAVVSSLFDEQYYLSQQKQRGRNTSQFALLSYLSSSGLSEPEPNLFFDSAYYADQIGSIATNKPLLQHYASFGEALELSPHPLFHRKSYKKRANVPDGVDTFQHFLENTDKGISPHPLFDPDYFVRQVGFGLKRGLALKYYLENKSSWRFAPHPLFDPQYYNSQISSAQEINLPPLVHYLGKGWKLGLRPTRLFDPEFYSNSAELKPDTEPLTHYVTSVKRGSPNYLFDEAAYRKLAGLKDDHIAGLEHYLATGAEQRLRTHPLFWPKYYTGELLKAGVIRVDKVADPLGDYLERGWRLGLSTNPYFDPEFYCRQANIVYRSEDALRHYLSKNGYKSFSPHPLINSTYYAKAVGKFEWDEINPIEYLLNATKPRISPHPFFDENYYLRANKDISNAGLCPVTHYFEHGVKEGRSPNGIFSKEYVNQRNAGRSLIEATAAYHHFSSLSEDPVRVVFVSHDASRTGAPAIVLRLIEDFAKAKNVECLTILDRGGDRLSEFREVSHTHVLSKSFHEVGHNWPGFRTEIEALLRLFGENQPRFAIVNSAESRHVGFILAELGIPVIWLVHELPEFYQPNVFPRISAASKLLVFPSQYVAEAAKGFLGEDETKFVVKGQGLLSDHFGELDRDECRKTVCKELGIPENSFIAISCGSIDLRKGVDYFVAAARDFLRNPPPGIGSAYFLWVGEGPRWANTPYHYAQKEIENEALEEHIRFIGARADVEPYFRAADVFMLTSRADPFPCVVHEAMAAGLPVVGFKGSGGGPELYELGGGRSASFGRVPEMVSKLKELATDEATRLETSERSRNLIKSDWQFRGYTEFFFNYIREHFDFSVDADFDELSNSADCSVIILKSKFNPALDRNMCDFVRLLVSEGADARIIFPMGRFTEVKSGESLVSSDELPVEYLQPTGPHDPKAILSLHRRLRRFKAPVVVVSATDPLASHSRELCKRSHVIGIVDNYENEKALEVAYIQGRFWSSIIVQSDADAERLYKINPSYRKKTKVIEAGSSSIGRSQDFIEHRAKQLENKPIEFALVADIQTAVDRRRAHSAASALLSSLANSRILLIIDGDQSLRLAKELSADFGAQRVAFRRRPDGLLYSPDDRSNWRLLDDAFALMIFASDAEVGIIEQIVARGLVPIVIGPVAPHIEELIKSTNSGFVGETHEFPVRASQLADVVKQSGSMSSLLSQLQATTVASHRVYRRSLKELKRLILEVSKTKVASLVQSLDEK